MHAPCQNAVCRQLLCWADIHSAVEKSRIRILMLMLILAFQSRPIAPPRCEGWSKLHEFVLYPCEFKICVLVIPKLGFDSANLLSSPSDWPRLFQSSKKKYNRNNPPSVLRTACCFHRCCRRRRRRRRRFSSSMSILCEMALLPVSLLRPSFLFT
jgi:hypothetical protein